MEIHLKKNQAAEIMFPMVDSSTPANLKSGLTVTDTGYYKDGAGAWTSLAITDTATEIATTGMYTIEMTAGELNHDLIMIKMTGSGAADSVIIIRTFARDIEDLAYPATSGRSLNVTASGNIGIDWANVENPTTAVDLSGTDIQLCDTVTTNTDMRGTDSAALASTALTNATWTDARAGYLDELAAANLPADVDAILLDTAEIGTAGAGLTAIPTQDANVIQIDGQATSGNNATLNLKQLNIVNSAGSALVASSTGSNGHGISASGNGTGEGLSAVGGSGGGYGIQAEGGGGAHGAYFAGSATGGSGIYSQSQGGNGHGIQAAGNGSGEGMSLQGGATGHGLVANGGATSGNGIQATAQTSGQGMHCEGAGAGNGFRTYGSSTGGSGIYCLAQGGNGNGFIATGQGTGHGMTLVKGSTGKDLDADQTDDILTDTNEIQGKLPSKSYLSGSADADGGIDSTEAGVINAEVSDVIKTDTITLPGKAAPSNTPTLEVAISWLYKAFRNRKSQTSTTWSLYADNETTVDSKATVSDDGSTAIKQEIVSGP